MDEFRMHSTERLGGGSVRSRRDLDIPVIHYARSWRTTALPANVTASERSMPSVPPAIIRRCTDRAAPRWKAPAVGGISCVQ